jgi:DNA-3-methyladenine glycosylase II
MPNDTLAFVRAGAPPACRRLVRDENTIVPLSDIHTPSSTADHVMAHSESGPPVPEASRANWSSSSHEVPVAAPYRLDLTVTALRRLSTNVVDILTPHGQYIRAHRGANGPIISRVTQVRSDALGVTIEGDVREHARTLALVRLMLGVDRDLSQFDGAAATIPWLAPLVARMRGVKPPRYPSLWEACANAIVFQQVSLRAASTIMHRLIVALGQSVDIEDAGVRVYTFPTEESGRSASDSLLRSVGLSANKVGALRRVLDAVASGMLDAAALDECASRDAAAVLRRIKGIGPWTAAVILLRGLGRLDVFPANDTSVASNIALVAGAAPLDVSHLLEDLGSQAGMLYFHLLLARLESRGEIGRPSI